MATTRTEQEDVPVGPKMPDMAPPPGAEQREGEPRPAPTPTGLYTDAPAAFRSQDGLVSFDRGGQRLDSMGHGTGTYENINDLVALQQQAPPPDNGNESTPSKPPAPQGGGFGNYPNSPAAGRPAGMEDAYQQYRAGERQSQGSNDRPYRYWQGPSGRTHVLPIGDMAGVRVVKGPDGSTYVEGDPPPWAAADSRPALPPAAAAQQYREGERGGPIPYGAPVEQALPQYQDYLVRQNNEGRNYASNDPYGYRYGQGGRGGAAQPYQTPLQRPSGAVGEPQAGRSNQGAFLPIAGTPRPAPFQLPQGQYPAEQPLQPGWAQAPAPPPITLGMQNAVPNPVSSVVGPDGRIIPGTTMPVLPWRGGRTE